MKEVFILILALTGAGISLFNMPGLQSSLSEDIYTEFESWKIKHSIEFENYTENLYRFGVYLENKAFVESFNAGKHSFRLGMTRFAANKEEEFKSQRKQQQYSEDRVIKNYVPKNDIPDSVNWVKKGAVTPVEKQGKCECGYAFAAKEALEGIYQIKTDNLISFSAQQLVDCVTFDDGCISGNILPSLDYVQFWGIESESDYPYTSGSSGFDGNCAEDEEKIVFKSNVAYQLPKQKQQPVLDYLADQPLASFMNGESMLFRLYEGGVIDDIDCGWFPDHGVLITGYDLTAEKPYFEIKNSWGTDWGENGYAQLALIGDGFGTCGILQEVDFPTYEP